MRNRLFLIVLFFAAFILLSLPIVAAPSAQSTLPDFTLNAQTVISVTVAITDGQVIVVPVDLSFFAKTEDGQTDVSLITGVDQQAGIFIGATQSPAIAATVQLPQVAGAAPSETTDASPQTGDGDGTHVANRNSNLRAGPGTNFEIVGNVRSGAAVTVVDQNSNGTWYQLDNGRWIAAFLVDPIGNNNGNTDGNTGEDNNDSGDDNGNDESGGDTTDDDNTDDGTTNDGTIDDDSTGDDRAAQADLTTYLLSLSSIGVGAEGAVSSLSGLVQNPSPFTPDWNDAVNAQLSVLSDALDQYLALTPVAGYEDLHDQVTGVALTCEQALDYLRSGVENPLSIDPTLALQATQNCSAQADGLSAVVQSFQ